MTIIIDDKIKCIDDCWITQRDIVSSLIKIFQPNSILKIVILFHKKGMEQYLLRSILYQGDKIKRETTNQQK